MNPNLTPYQHRDEETYFTIFFSCYPWYNQGTEYKKHAVKQRRPVKQMINNTNGMFFGLCDDFTCYFLEQDCRLGLFS